MIFQRKANQWLIVVALIIPETTQGLFGSFRTTISLALLLACVQDTASSVNFSKKKLGQWACLIFGLFGGRGLVVLVVCEIWTALVFTVTGVRGKLCRLKTIVNCREKNHQKSNEPKSYWVSWWHALWYQRVWSQRVSTQILCQVKVLSTHFEKNKGQQAKLKGH